jgi:[lysine-biosynthesis-protein LysW]--L-2-aminoadipate ligase
MHCGVLYTRIREDEKLLVEALRAAGHDVTKIDVRELCFHLEDAPAVFDDVDVTVNRCLESSRSRYVTRLLDSYGVDVVNNPLTTAICADKVWGSVALLSAGVPTPRTTVAFTPESALAAIEAFGYPCVLKPVTGSWGRLISRIDTRAAAETVLEHKDVLGGYEHKVFYVQEYVEKPGRDIRVLTCDAEPVAAMTRTSDHWLTNAARGATTEQFELDEAAADVARRASEAVGGGLLGVDLMETGAGGTESQAGYVCHEVNSQVEFKSLNAAAADVDVPARIVEWLERRVETT